MAFMTVELNNRLLASKGEGRGEGNCGAAEHAPKTWWLEDLWSGRSMPSGMSGLSAVALYHVI